MFFLRQTRKRYFKRNHVDAFCGWSLNILGHFAFADEHSVCTSNDEKISVLLPSAELFLALNCLNDLYFLLSILENVDDELWHWI